MSAAGLSSFQVRQVARRSGDPSWKNNRIFHHLLQYGPTDEGRANDRAIAFSNKLIRTTIILSNVLSSIE